MKLQQQQFGASPCNFMEFMRFIYFHILTIFLFILFFNTPICAEDLDHTLARIQNRYQSITSFSGKFIQISHRLDEDSITAKAEGTLWLAKKDTSDRAHEKKDREHRANCNQTS